MQVSEKKVLKQATKAVWERVKALRAERAKLYSADEVAASAAALSKCTNELEQISSQLSALSAMPPDAMLDVTPKPRRTKKKKAP